MKTVFIVDDAETNLLMAKKALEGKYTTHAMPSAARMFRLLKKIMPDLILMDVDMPEVDGFQAMEKLKADDALKSIPVVFLTARLDVETEVRGFELGALDFITKPFSPMVLIRRIEMHIEKDKLIKHGLKSTRKLYKSTISAIAAMVDSREHESGEHIMRAQKYFSVLARYIAQKKEYKDEISKWDMDMLGSMSLLHDIGKICISDKILNKQGKLTNEEYEIVKTHCEESEKLIDVAIAKTHEWKGFLMVAKNIAGMHHEKWDGSGYPKGLSGLQIALEARIFAVANVYDALTNKRPFRDAYQHEDALKIIREESGRHFDPKIVEAFLDVSDFVKALSG